MASLHSTLHTWRARQRRTERVGGPLLVFDGDDAVQGADLLHLEHPTGDETTLPKEGQCGDVLVIHPGDAYALAYLCRVQGVGVVRLQGAVRRRDRGAVRIVARIA